MIIKSCFAAVLFLLASVAAYAQQPLAIPARSQNPAQRAVDTAACYAQANSQTHIDMARQPQAPPPLAQQAATPPREIQAPQPLHPPLPASASGASEASAAPPAAPASTVAAPGTASATVAASTSAAASTAATGGATAAQQASGVPVGASDASAAQQTGEATMPPLPPPEPPMVTYWHAYSDCMQSRGYYVR